MITYDSIVEPALAPVYNRCNKF